MTKASQEINEIVASVARVALAVQEKLEQATERTGASPEEIAEAMQQHAQERERRLLEMEAQHERAVQSIQRRWQRY